MAVLAPARPRSSDAVPVRLGRPLAAFAFCVVVLMQIGPLAEPLGSVGNTRWADWVDLLTPYAVLGTAALVLWRAAAGRSEWALLALGGVTFCEGHGIHLAANSVDNVEELPVAHLWDEVVGHYVWYTGLALVVIALALALRERRVIGTDPTARAGAVALTGLFGLTIFDNIVEGGVVAYGFVMCGLMLAVGWRTRRGAGRLLLAAYGLTVILLVGWGAWWGSFPQFSQLGWI